MVDSSITPSSNPAIIVTGLNVEPGADNCCVARLNKGNDALLYIL